MKNFRIITLLGIVFLIENTYLFGQCANIELYSQEEVNNFIKNFGKCKSLINLKILGNNEDYQFDSLYNLEQIEGTFELQISKSKNLNGLHNIKFVNQMDLYAYNLSNTFLSLDTINDLKITSDSTGYRALNKVRHISNSLRIIPTDYCSSNHLVNFTTGSNFSLILGFGNFASSNCLKRLSNNIQTKYLKKLNLRAGYYDLSILNFIDSLETLILSSTSSSSNFSTLEKLTNLRHIEIEWDESGNKYGDGFKRTYDLDTLRLNHNKSIKNYYNIFPSLKTVSGQLEIIGNDALLNLEFLKDVTLTNELNDSVAILIQDNKLLNDCNVTFLCEVLARYPESAIMQNNGAKCTKEEIIKYCKTVNTNDTNKSQLLISPNPTNGNLKIENLSSPASVTITNINGHTLKTLHNVENEVDISELPAGMYFIDIRNKDISERHKIVKVE